MRRGLWVLLTAILLATPASAENFLKKLGRELDRASEDLSRALGGSRSPSGSAQARQSGTCVTYNGDGIKSDEQKCVQVRVCPTRTRCVLTYHWPSGLKTVLDIDPEGDQRLNGQAGLMVPMGDVICMTNLATTNSFCFLYPGTGPLPRVSDALRVHRGRGNAGVASNDEAQGLPAEEEGFFTGLQRRAEEYDRNQELQAQADQRAKDLAERQAMIDLIGKMTDDAEIERYFRDLSLDDLAPVDAASKCQDLMLARAASIARPVPVEAATSLSMRCETGAETYGRRLALELGDKRIADIIAKPATLDGLTENNWFRLDEAIPLFSARQRAEIVQHFDAGIRGHRDQAIKTAQGEIAKAFQAAVPLTESGDSAWKLCDLQNNPPDELIETCKLQRDQFDKRVKAARCDRAIEQSGASRGMLDMPMQASGPGYELWPLRRVICAGTANHPNYRIEIGNGFIPLFSSPSITIHEGESRKLLDVELHVATSRDGRSFGKLLYDIATGENEKPVQEVLVVERVRFADTSISRADDRAIVGCALGFIRCR